VPPTPEILTYCAPADVALELHIFRPAAWIPSDRRAAWLFFHGGGFSGGSPELGYDIAAAVAESGRVAICIQYRHASGDASGTRLDALVSDAKAAVRWVRAHATVQGIDPARVVAGGHSAGGMLAAATALVPGFEVGDHLGESSVPDAFMPWSGALILRAGSMAEVFAPVQGSIEDVSPFHHIGGATVPSVVLHGDNDALVPHVSSEVFVERLRAVGSITELVTIEGADHFFFDPMHRERLIDETLAALDRLGC
jgi:acetyl esterase/lipase